MKRNLFDELMSGVAALEEEREGKRTLRTLKFEKAAPAPTPIQITAAEIRSMREQANVSRPVLARRLRVNPRTLENWEQGRAQPNPQAAVLIRLVEKHPEMMEMLDAL